MNNKDSSYLPSSSYKFLVIALAVVIEVEAIKRSEGISYSVATTSVVELQIAAKPANILDETHQQLCNELHADENNAVSTLTAEPVANQALFVDENVVSETQSSAACGQNNQGSSEFIINDIQQELDRRLRRATDKKVVLIWISMFGIESPININFSKCGNCEVTYDRKRIDDSNVGAVVFHFDGVGANTMPPARNLDQLYIYWDTESAATLRVVRGHSLKFEDSFKFNATMTYRRDSDFYASYQTDLTVVLKQNLTLDEILKMKTKSAVAIVSNCGFTSGARTRIKMLKELMGLGLNMKGFGGCFKGGRFANGKRRGTQEFRNEIRKYKFYFSFENSYHCKDYITEKLFDNALRSLSVPVVWGATKEDYEAVAPPGSFIFAEDFASMKDLADYLKYLIKNDTAYLEYFRWVTMKPNEISPQYGRTESWCQICRALHGINFDDIYNPKYSASNPRRLLFTDGIAQRTTAHLIDWFYGEDNPECFQK